MSRSSAGASMPRLWPPRRCHRAPVISRPRTHRRSKIFCANDFARPASRSFSTTKRAERGERVDPGEAMIAERHVEIFRKANCIMFQIGPLERRFRQGLEPHHLEYRSLRSAPASIQLAAETRRYAFDLDRAEIGKRRDRVEVELNRLHSSAFGLDRPRACMPTETIAHFSKASGRIDRASASAAPRNARQPWRERAARRRQCRA